MARDFTAVLQQAMEFYVAGQIVEARALLLDVVRADSKVEAGWMFLSYTLDEPNQKADCYRKVLAINPQNAEARTALEKLEAELKIEPGPPRRTAELLHAEPFTVDIDQANEDVSFLGQEAIPPPSPKVPPAPAPSASIPPGRQSTQAAPIQESASEPSTSPLKAAPAPASSAPAPSTSPLPVQPTSVSTPQAAPVPAVPAQAPSTSPPPVQPAPAPAPQAVSAPAASVQLPGSKPLQPPAKASAAATAPVSASVPPPASAKATASTPIPVPPFLTDTPTNVAPAAGKTETPVAPSTPPEKRAVKGKPATGPIHAVVSAKPETKHLAAQEQEKTKKRGNRGCTCLILAIVLVLIAAGIGVGLWAAGYIPTSLFAGLIPTPATATPTATNTPLQLITLPPEWTPTPTPTITLTPTITSTPTQTLTPTFVPPDATVQADMDKVEAQVEDLRGLKLKESLPVYVVNTGQAESILQEELDRVGYRETIGNESKALVALGFIKPTYDLSKYALARLADGVLGFYMPFQQTVFVIGNRFAGMEKYVFSHEFDHALVHDHFTAVGITEDDPICADDSQRCEAIRALVEGDAVLVMLQWYLQYASAYDKQDIGEYRMPFGMPPADNTPPYAAPMVNFSYNQGAAFVLYFYNKGNWARVNKIYQNLPVSTEQILHPIKYESGEKPAAMNLPDLKSILGETWTLVKSDSLGEFMTYLLLGYGADAFAQIPDANAMAASAGWGGDHYLVLASSQNDQTLLAAEWTWDSDKDTTEFLTRMKEHLNMRFRGEKTETSKGDCWTMNGETACIFRSGRNTLWVLGPDMDKIGGVRSAYRIY